MSLLNFRQPGVELDAEHVYRLNGQTVPGTTEILSAMGMVRDLSFLDPFYRQRGSAVHAAVALHLRGEEIDWDFEGSEHVRPRCERLFRLAKAKRIEPILVETPLVSLACGYGGTEDLLCRWDGDLAIVDFKGDAYEDGHAVQVDGAYRGLLQEVALAGHLPGITAGDIMSAPAYLVPLGTENGGGLPKVSSPINSGGQNTALFRGAVAVYNWRRARNLMPMPGRCL